MIYLLIDEKGRRGIKQRNWNPVQVLLHVKDIVMELEKLLPQKEYDLHKDKLLK